MIRLFKLIFNFILLLLQFGVDIYFETNISIIQNNFRIYTSMSYFQN